MPLKGAFSGSITLMSSGRITTPENERKARVQEMLELVNLAGYDRRNIHQLSGGRVTNSLSRMSRSNPTRMGSPSKSTEMSLRLTILLSFRYALFPHLNVFENVEFGLKLRKVPENERKARVQEMLVVSASSWSWVT